MRVNWRIVSESHDEAVAGVTQHVSYLLPGKVPISVHVDALLGCLLKEKADINVSQLRSRCTLPFHPSKSRLIITHVEADEDDVGGGPQGAPVSDVEETFGRPLLVVDHVVAVAGDVLAVDGV